MTQQLTAHDAGTYIREQHTLIRELFAEVEAATDVTRRQAFEPLVRLLAVHETAEELVIYPAIKVSGDEGKRIAKQRLAEEDEAKKTLAELEGMDPASMEFATLFAKFRKAVEQHAAAEETEVLPLLESIRDDESLRRMSSALRFAESIAPTHGHRAAPEGAIGNMVVGPFVAVVDRIRDAMRDSLA